MTNNEQKERVEKAAAWAMQAKQPSGNAEGYLG
jgi:hypothetical protein